MILFLKVHEKDFLINYREMFIINIKMNIANIFFVLFCIGIANALPLEINAVNTPLIIVDAGSGIRELSIDIEKRKKKPSEFHVFLTHFHWDHIMGFLYFTPFYDDSYTFNIYGYNKHTSTSSFSKKIFD